MINNIKRAIENKHLKRTLATNNKENKAARFYFDNGDWCSISANSFFVYVNDSIHYEYIYLNDDNTIMYKKYVHGKVAHCDIIRYEDFTNEENERLCKTIEKRFNNVYRINK